MAIKVLILSAFATNAVGQVFSTVRSEEATAVEIDENGNAQHVLEEENVRPPMSDLLMPRPSIVSHVQAPITIVSIFSGPYDVKKDVWRNVATNHEEYAETHGYGYVQFDGPCMNRADAVRLGDASWDALLAVADVQKRVDPNAWIFWMDPDSSFANMTKKLEDFLPQDEGVDAQKSLVITGDTTGFNSGHFFIRANKWSEQFLMDAWSVYSSAHKSQHGMAAVLGGADVEEKETWQAAMDKLSGNWFHPETLDKIRRALPAEISSAVELVEFRSLASDDDQDFIVHAAGESIAQSEKILREM
jgi:hypothetical protein